MKHKKHIAQPYETPQGYFDDFNAKVMDKIESKKQSKTSGKWRVVRYYAYTSAAAVLFALFGYGLYKILLHSENQGSETATLNKHLLQKDTVIAEQIKTNEDLLMQHWVEDTVNNQVVAVQETPKNKEEQHIEAELEAEGLIVRDVETGWLDETEILP